MAPAVSLPSLEMSQLPDCKRRWADIEDIGTPSPWPDNPLSEFKPVWPDTPTPLDAICDINITQPKILAQTCLESSETSVNGVPDLSDLPLNVMEGPNPMLTQICLPSSEMLVPSAAVPVGMSLNGTYVALAQTYPALSDMSVSCAVGPIGMAGQQHMQSYEVPQSWGCDFNDLNNASVANGYAVAMQWPSFHLPQPSNPSEVLQLPEQWPRISEEASAPTRSEAPPPPLAKATILSQKDLQHESGQCRPCAWFYRPQGCKNGEDCGYCHRCPEGELKSRKKNKIAALRMGALAPVKDSTEKGGAWGLKLDSLIQDKP